MRLHARLRILYPNIVQIPFIDRIHLKAAQLERILHQFLQVRSLESALSMVEKADLTNDLDGGRYCTRAYAWLSSRYASST